MAALNETNRQLEKYFDSATIIIFEKKFKKLFSNMYKRILFRKKLNFCTENIQQKKKKIKSRENTLIFKCQKHLLYNKYILPKQMAAPNITKDENIVNFKLQRNNQQYIEKN